MTLPTKSQPYCDRTNNESIDTRARLMRVLEVKTVRGRGTETSPKRIVTQYFGLGGKLLAEDDPLMPVRWVPRMEMFDWRSGSGDKKFMMPADEDE